MEVMALAAGCPPRLACPSFLRSATFRYPASRASSSVAALVGSVAYSSVLDNNPRAPRSRGSAATLNCISLLSTPARGVACAAKAERNAFEDVQVEEDVADFGWVEAEEEETAEEGFGEVDLILASRVEDRKTEYLILWRDDHPDSWEPASNIAADLVAEYEKPWWQAARKADIAKLKELLDYEELQRDVNAVDENERTALLFAAGQGSEKCVRFLIEEYGADVHWQDKDGYTALHIAAGYVHVNTVKALVELGADPDLEDAKGRSALSLAQQLLNGTPKANPLQFARRLALDQVVKALDEVMYETVEVEQVLDKRTVEGGLPEYFVRWSDESENSWVSAKDIGEDLIKDYEEGLEYGVVEEVLDRREVDGVVQYFVRWSDGKDTWEPEENVGDEVVAEFNNSKTTQ